MTSGSSRDDEALFARIEDAGLNASAPREQRWIDGWMLRLSPGKAKRARCIQPVAAGRLGIDEKLALCLPLFAAAGLQPFIRITPFAQPPDLDRHLDSLGMARIDDTRVMVLPSLAAFAEEPARVVGGDSGGSSVVETDAFFLVDWVGGERGSTVVERRAHADRVLHSPVPYHAMVVRDADGRTVAGGQVAIEGRIAGLYDVFTAESARGRGHGERVCRRLLALAGRDGASVGYLQVDAANDVARRIYRRLGFGDAYPYHYRSPVDAGATGRASPLDGL